MIAFALHRNTSQPKKKISPSRRRLQKRREGKARIFSKDENHYFLDSAIDIGKYRGWTPRGQGHTPRPFQGSSQLKPSRQHSMILLKSCLLPRQSLTHRRKRHIGRTRGEGGGCGGGLRQRAKTLEPLSRNLSSLREPKSRFKGGICEHPPVPLHPQQHIESNQRLKRPLRPLKVVSWNFGRVLGDLVKAAEYDTGIPQSPKVVLLN